MAELGLGLAGFAGVAAAFGGRSREYGTTDLVRLKVLFFSAGSTVAGCLTVFTFASYGLDEANSYLIISAVLALVSGAAGVPLLRAAYGIVRDSKAGAPAWVFLTGMTYFVIVETLYVSNLFKGGEPGALIAAFSLSLVYGLWMFTRLMVRPNW